MPSKKEKSYSYIMLLVIKLGPILNQLVFIHKLNIIIYNEIFDLKSVKI